MMAEVIVVSAVVLVTLTSLYISYNKILSLYRTRLTYNDVTTLYRLAYYKDCFIDEGKLNELNNNTVSIDSYLSNHDFLNVKDKGKIFIVYNNKQKIESDVLNLVAPNINKTYKDYVSYLSNAVNLSDTDYVMLMEYCETIDDCKYAYLELQ